MTRNQLALSENDAAGWEQLNRRSFAHSLRPVALPQRDGIPFWNRHARQFIMPPAFEIPVRPGAAGYRFSVTTPAGAPIAEFTADSPQEPLTAIWDRVPVGTVKLTVAALDRDGAVLPQPFEREFYRCAWFHGPYPSISHDYSAAARRCLAYIYGLPHVQGWLHGGTVDEKIYRKYCYPTKTMSAIIRALLRHSDLSDDAQVRANCLEIACKMGDWLIDNSCPAGTPLEFLPPTYWKHATYHLAKPHIGQIMMIYPMVAGGMYLELHRRTGKARYLEAAVRLANTMGRLELPDGSWYLVYREDDGRPVVENVVLITRTMMEFLSGLSAATGDPSYAAMGGRACKRLIDQNLRLWNWDGQFEDVIPQEMYKNLTKNHAHELAASLMKQGQVKTALEIVDWSEDQFVVWSDPNPAIGTSMYPGGDKNNGMVMPTALEQYNCYWPVDASMSNFISVWTKAYKCTGDNLYLEKARAMADAILRNQRPDGSIPTWFFDTDLPDWLNCMVYSAETLLELADALYGR